MQYERVPEDLYLTNSSLDTTVDYFFVPLLKGFMGRPLGLPGAAAAVPRLNPPPAGLPGVAPPAPNMKGALPCDCGAPNEKPVLAGAD